METIRSELAHLLRKVHRKKGEAGKRIHLLLSYHRQHMVPDGEFLRLLKRLEKEKY